MRIDLENQLKEVSSGLNPAQRMTLSIGIANLSNSALNHISRYGDISEHKKEVDSMEDNPENMLILAGRSIDYGIGKFRQEYDAVEDFNFLGEKKEDLREKIAKEMEVTSKTFFLTQFFRDYINYKSKEISGDQQRAMSKDEVQKTFEGYIDEAIQKLGGLEELRAPARQLVRLLVNIADSEF